MEERTDPNFLEDLSTSRGNTEVYLASEMRSCLVDGKMTGYCLDACG